jgi:hypothetical protein
MVSVNWSRVLQAAATRASIHSRTVDADHIAREATVSPDRNLRLLIAACCTRLPCRREAHQGTARVQRPGFGGTGMWCGRIAQRAPCNMRSQRKGALAVKGKQACMAGVMVAGACSASSPGNLASADSAISSGCRFSKCSRHSSLPVDVAGDQQWGWPS